jgi:hypothetical protein
LKFAILDIQHPLTKILVNGLPLGKAQAKVPGIASKFLANARLHFPVAL